MFMVWWVVFLGEMLYVMRCFWVVLVIENNNEVKEQ